MTLRGAGAPGARRAMGALLAGLCWVQAAAALTDLPTTDRRALDVADLASAAGVAAPADTAVLPLDDDAYLAAYRALEPRGLVDARGAWYDALAGERGAGGLAAGGLVPRLDLRAYWLGGGSEEWLLLHSSGDRLEKGVSTFLTAEGEASWGSWLGGGYSLQARQAPGDLKGEVKRLYLKGRLGKWSLKVGRDTVRLGPGYHGSLLLDDNAPPLDLWQVRTEEPLFLPGFLAGLGGFRLTLLNAYLSDDQPESVEGARGGVEDPRVLGMRFSYHPAPWLDLGLSRAIEYGGKGRETYDTLKDWWELFSAKNENVFEGQDDRYDNDQYASFDLTLRMPFLNGLGPLKAGKVYWEHGGTDILASWQGDEVWGARLAHTADLGGLYLSTAVTDLRAEWARTDPAWYHHHKYAQGYTYRGRPLGHHMGGDAQDLFVQVSRYFGPSWRCLASLDLEERGRSQAEPEKRTEGRLAIESLRLSVLGAVIEGRIDASWADVKHPLDEPSQDGRNEVYFGLSVGIPL